MPKPKNLKLSQDKVSQVFDLKKIFGFDVSRNAALKRAFGQAVIDRILDRTKSGVDYEGKKFAPYSESYKNSLMFKAFRKSSNVDMELTSEMLLSMDILSIDGNKVEIGFTSEQAAKAFGHMTGMEGHPRLEGVTPARRFFGVTDDELSGLAGEFKPRPGKTDAATDGLVDKILKVFEKKNGS
jgi:hypothetical protein